MFKAIFQKLDFSGPNLGLQPLVFVFILYLVIIVCTYHSISTLAILRRTKILWAVFVTVFPFIGLIVSLFYCGYQNLKTHPILGRYVNPKQQMAYRNQVPTKAPPAPL